MYRLTTNPEVVIRIEDGASIPLSDPDGFAQKQYATFLAAGGVAQPAIVPDLAASIAAALVQIDGDADSIRRAVIGERATEYQVAYDEATTFKAGNYTGTVPATVQSWVDAKAAGGVTWTAQQAADDILATAQSWTSAQYAIRAHRLKAKEQAKVAADTAGVASVLAGWSAFVAAMRSQLGV